MLDAVKASLTSGSRSIGSASPEKSPAATRVTGQCASVDGGFPVVAIRPRLGSG
jgi:hypothetical protein